MHARRITQFYPSGQVRQHVIKARGEQLNYLERRHIEKYLYRGFRPHIFGDEEPSPLQVRWSRRPVIEKVFAGELDAL